jgi:hypothetical protein
MSSNYYIRFRGEVSGPVAEERLSELVRIGTLSALHEVSIDQARWITVRAWLIARNTPPPIPNLVPPPAAASTHFRIEPCDDPQSSRNHERVASRKKIISTLALTSMIGALAGNVFWMVRTYFLEIESTNIGAMLMLAIPGVLALASIALGIWRITLGSPRLIAFISLALAVWSIGTTGVGVVLEMSRRSTAESNVSHQVSSPSAPPTGGV